MCNDSAVIETPLKLTMAYQNLNPTSQWHHYERALEVAIVGFGLEQPHAELPKLRSSQARGALLEGVEPR